jgi:predicted metal-binding membrane protein
VCLSHCRSPLDFALHHWRFAAGIMSLVWMAAITAFVLVEKLFPAGHLIARIGGIAMLGLALYLLIQR